MMFYSSHYLKSSPPPPPVPAAASDAKEEHQARSGELFATVIVVDEVHVHPLLNISRRGVISEDVELIFAGRPVPPGGFLPYSPPRRRIYGEALSGGL